MLVDNLSGGVPDLQGNIGLAVDRRLDGHVRRGFRDILLRDMQAIRAELGRVEIDVPGGHVQPGRIVQTAVLVEVRAHGDHVDVLRIVAYDLDRILSSHQQALEVHGEGGIAALVNTGLPPVHADGRLLRGALEQEIRRTLGIPYVDGAPIRRRAAVILGAPAVNGIVGMRDRNGFPSGAVLGELPFNQRRTAFGGIAQRVLRGMGATPEQRRAVSSIAERRARFIV